MPVSLGVLHFLWQWEAMGVELGVLRLGTGCGCPWKDWGQVVGVHGKTLPKSQIWGVRNKSNLG